MDPTRHGREVAEVVVDGNRQLGAKLPNRLLSSDERFRLRTFDIHLDEINPIERGNGLIDGLSFNFDRWS